MKRILFVDDEPQVLEGLQGLLRKQRKVWDMRFVDGGHKALEALAAGAYDVVVSDMRMPGMDGAELMRHVQRDFPQVVRIVLSGQSEQELCRRMVHIAHQFLSKPCDGVQLKNIIERALALQALLAEPALRRMVGQIAQLPVRPTVYARLLQLLESPTSAVADVAQLIESDIGSASKLLQVVNSAFFGLPRRVADLQTAVSYLGLDAVKTLVLTVEMRQAMGDMSDVPGFSMDLVQERALFAARLARRLLPDKVQAQEAAAAAMLADTGLLVLGTRLPERFRAVVAEVGQTGRPLDEAERERLGVTHSEVGAYLLGIWGLPYGIVEAVAHHHHPGQAQSTGLDVVAAAHVASALAVTARPGPPGLIAAGVTLDEGYLAQLGLSDRLPTWRALAESEASKPPPA